MSEFRVCPRVGTQQEHPLLPTLFVLWLIPKMQTVSLRCTGAHACGWSSVCRDTDSVKTVVTVSVPILMEGGGNVVVINNTGQTRSVFFQVHRSL